MSSVVISTPAGTPSRTPTRASPCDSPAVNQRMPGILPRRAHLTAGASSRRVAPRRSQPEHRPDTHGEDAGECGAEEQPGPEGDRGRAGRPAGEHEQQPDDPAGDEAEERAGD